MATQPKQQDDTQKQQGQGRVAVSTMKDIR